MLRILKTLALTGVLLLAACGGSGGSSGSSGVTVSPSGTQILAGASRQMTATAADGSTTFTWQVNGTTGGGSSVGTISANGLYTAPDLPPAGGKVTITAIEQANAMSSGTAMLNIGYSNISLNGDYVFSLGGRNQGAPWFVIGELSTNGAGQISNGLQDINNGSTIQSKASFGGSYSINPDGSGSLMLGTLNFQLVLQAGGSAFLISVSNGTMVTGSLSPQDPAANSVRTLNGPLVLSSGGQVGNQGFALLALANTGNASALSGFEDVSGPNPLLRASWTGSYTFDGNAHGTLSIKDTNGTHNYSYYTVSASNFALLSTDPTVTASGNFTSQTAMTYSSTSLNGPYAFLMNGNSATQGYAQAGQFNPNGMGSLGTVTEDINTLGNLQTDLITAGTYAFDPSVNGRGTLTINNQGTGAPTSYVFYMLSPQLAEFITTNSNFVAGGYIVIQTQGSAFTNSSLNGTYAFALGTQTGATSLSAAVGTLSLDGNGNLSGQMTQNINGAPSTLSLSGSYMLNGSVRGTAMLISSGGGSSPFAIYPLNSSEFLLIGTDPASPYFGIATIQN